MNNFPNLMEDRIHRQSLPPRLHSNASFDKSDSSMMNHVSGDDLEDDEVLPQRPLFLDPTTTGTTLLFPMDNRPYQSKSSHSSNDGVFGDDDDDDDDETSVVSFGPTSLLERRAGCIPSVSLSQGHIMTSTNKRLQSTRNRTWSMETQQDTNNNQTFPSIHSMTRTKHTMVLLTKSSSMEPQYSDNDDNEEEEEYPHELQATTAATTACAAKSTMYKQPKKSINMRRPYDGTDEELDMDNDQKFRNTEITAINIETAPYKKYTMPIATSDSLEKIYYQVETLDSDNITPCNLSLDSPPVEHLVLSSPSKRQSTRRKTSYDNVVTASVARQSVASIGTMDDTNATQHWPELTNRPAFHQFALLSLPLELILRRLHDDRMLYDDGPRNMDAFVFKNVQFLDCFPSEHKMDPPALSAFCFPEGLRIRFLPKACLEGAERLGLVGPNGDRCHILLFTNEAGECDHGVAITIQQEIVLAKGERMALLPTILERHQRRLAATKISRWFKMQFENRILLEALQISGFENLFVEELKAALTAGEIRILARTLGRIPQTESSRKSGHGKSMLTSSSSRIQEKLRSILSRTGKEKGRDARSRPSRQRSKAETLEVTNVTRNAMLRSGGSSHSPNSEEEDDPRETEKASGINLRRFRMHNSGSPHLPSQGSAKSRGGSNQSRVSSSSFREDITSHSVRKFDKDSPTEWAKVKGKESYDFMKMNEKKGFVCIVEKCYTLVGCQPDEHVLLLGPLQQLVNFERNEVMEFLKSSSDKGNMKLRSTLVTESRKVEQEQISRRHAIISSMLCQLRLTTRQSLVSFPRSQLLHVSGKQQYFSASFPELANSDDIRLPLPLPQVGSQWGLAKILLDLGPESLLFILKLLLLERSILVLGSDLQDVTACACALIELLKPFEWASAFMPILPRKMLDFLNSPVPFVAGMVVNDAARAVEVKNDERTVVAMADGMSLLNLTTNTLHITPEEGVSCMLTLDPPLLEQLMFLTTRLQLFCHDNPQSGLRNFQTFIRHGLNPQESLTLHSVCLALKQHFNRLCSDMGTSGSAWKKYVSLDGDRFTFSSELFLNPVRGELAFQEAVVQTQLFLGYVYNRREEENDMKALTSGELGIFIANWIYQRWSQKEQKRLQERNHCIEVSETEPYRGRV